MVSQEEVNQYIKNMQGNIQLPQLEAHHAGTVKQYLIDNLSKIGRGTIRDFERFGNLMWTDQRVEVHGRQDGWQALTKEVPHFDHLTYGTGILYVHGEMEIPADEDIQRDEGMINDEHYHVNRDGEQYVYKVCEEYDFWNDDPGEDGSTGDVGEKGPMGPNNLDPVSIKTLSGYRWEWITELSEGDDESGLWTWATIKEHAGGHPYDPAKDDKFNIPPSVEPELPPKFNDDEVYNVDNERHHYPFQIVHSAQAKAVSWLLDEELRGNNGMYDEKIPELANGTGWPPRRHGIKFPNGIDEVVDYISQVDETP